MDFRMEDPSSEWGMEEYYSSEDRHCSKVSWILNKGFGLGKKIVITGIVISSAPLILPPLVVISALGFAVSVPFGLVFASYACTEKLMRMLLPNPEPPLMWEYEKLSTNEEDYVGFGGEIDMEKEEEEEKDDTKGGVEMRIELVGKGSEEPQEEVYLEYNYDYGLKGVDKGEDVSAEKNGYEEDGGEYLDIEEKEPLEEKDVKIERMSEEGGGEILIEESKDEQPLQVAQRVASAVDGDEKNGYVEEVEELVVVLEPGFVKESGGEGKVIGIQEEEELVGETMGLLEKIGVEGNVDSALQEEEQPVKDMNAYIEKKDEKAEDKNVKLETLIREDEAIPKENKEEEELARETTGLIEKIRDEGNVDNGVKGGEMLGAGERDKNVSSVEKMDVPFETKHVKMEKFNRKKKGKKGKRGAEALPNKNEVPERNDEHMDIVPTEVKPVGEVGVIIHENEDGNNADNVLAVERPYGDSYVIKDGRRLGGVVQSVEEEQKPLVDNRSVMQGVKAKDQVVTDVHEGLRSEREKENVTKSSDASHMVYENPKVGIAEILELPVSAGVPKSKHAGISSEMDIAIASNQVLFSEEKIWEQMDAMRTIVGYKAAPQSTCLEELKALYTFTGVEPPASFTNPSDLVEVNHKLRFLMSIVGVK